MDFQGIGVLNRKESINLNTKKRERIGGGVTAERWEGGLKRSERINQEVKLLF